jgi:hypothetical protein
MTDTTMTADTTASLIEQRAEMLANASEYASIGPTPAEIDAREAAALADLSAADVDEVRARAHEIRRARLMARV